MVYATRNRECKWWLCKKKKKKKIKDVKWQNCKYLICIFVHFFSLFHRWKIGKYGLSKISPCPFTYLLWKVKKRNLLFIDFVSLIHFILLEVLSYSKPNHTFLILKIWGYFHIDLLSLRCLILAHQVWVYFQKGLSLSLKSQIININGSIIF